MAALPLEFETYLKTNLAVSGKTLRNYRADLGHFFRWSQQNLTTQGIEVKNLEDLLPYFGVLVSDYRDHHVSQGTPQSTTNRRLSTLRNFGKFLSHIGVTNHNPAELVANIKTEATFEQKLESVMQEFAKHLQKDGVSSLTVKNYLSDVRHFAAWLIKQEDWVKEQETQSL